MTTNQSNPAEQARARLLVDTVREAREAAERGQWPKVHRLINLATEIAKDLPKKHETESLTPASGGGEGDRSR